MRSILVYLLGVGFGKIMPLIFSFYVSKMAGNYEYSLLIAFFIKANLLSVISTISYSQIIFASKESNAFELCKYFWHSGIFSLIVSVAGSIWLTEDLDREYHYLATSAIAFYSFANSLLILKMAWLNKFLKNSEAGFLVFITLCITYALGFILVGLGVQLTIAMFSASLLFSLVSLFFFLRNRPSGSFFVGRGGAAVLYDSIPKTMSHIYVMIFAGAFLYSHSLIMSQTIMIEGHAVYAIGYQIFSIGIFLPGVLGAVLIPRLGMRISKIKLTIINMMIAYLVLTSLWVGGVYWLRMEIFNWFQIDDGINSMAVLIIMQVAVVAASLNAFLCQYWSSRGDYWLMAVSGVGYFVFVISCTSFFELSVMNSAIYLLSGYVVAILFSILARKLAIR